MLGSSPSRPLALVGRTVLTLAAGVAFVGAVALIGATQPRAGDGPNLTRRLPPTDGQVGR